MNLWPYQLLLWLTCFSSSQLFWYKKGLIVLAKNRDILYLITLLILVGLLAFNIITMDDLKEIFNLAGLALGIGSVNLARRHLTPDPPADDLP